MLRNWPFLGALDQGESFIATKIVTLPDLKRGLGTGVGLTVFRRLKELDSLKRTCSVPGNPQKGGRLELPAVFLANSPSHDQINTILGSTEAARFAVGYFFLSGFTAIAEKLEHVKEFRLLMGNTTNRETLGQIAEGYKRLELVKEAAGSGLSGLSGLSVYPENSLSSSRRSGFHRKPEGDSPKWERQWKTEKVRVRLKSVDAPFGFNGLALLRSVVNK